MVKNKKGKVIQMLSPENYIRQKARSLPIHECLVNSNWREEGMAQVVVIRKHTNGNFTIGMYLVDLKCLGIKDVDYSFNISPLDYQEIKERMNEHMEMENIPYILAHNIIFAGIEFADEYGFKPHKTFTSVAQYILDEDSDDVELIEIECGYAGKPMYVKGPFDTETQANKIIATLEKTAGSGNYNYILNMPEIQDDDDDDEFEDLFEPEAKSFQFKIQIEGITKPPVWRRIIVPSNFDFFQFHVAIQVAFGWTNSHLFQFSPNGFASYPQITIPFDDDMDDFSLGRGEVYDANQTILNKVFETEGDKFTYIYDFGDSWTHRITFEKTIDETLLFPKVIAGKGKCPPEDCGGVWGYENMKEVVLDKKHPEYKDFVEWMGKAAIKNWDASEFNQKEVQQLIMEVFTHQD